MTEDAVSEGISRRRALAVGSGGAGALLGASLGLSPPALARARKEPLKQRGTLPAKRMQEAIGAQGNVSGGILSIAVDRKDIGTVTGPQGVPFKPSFQIHGDLTFQPLGRDLAFFNGDLALKASELNPVIDAITRHGLVFQAMHQHFFDLSPMVWFIHFRGRGAPMKLAAAVRDVLRATSTPLPQTPPSKPTTPFSGKRLETILKGSGEVDEDGVITVTTSRKDTIVIDGVQVNPDVNVSTNVAFQPLSPDGSRAAVAPDFSMTSHEVQPVIRTMRAAGFEVGCLYNQEAGEAPQLYFAHMFAVGDPYDLARKIRRGLDRTNAD